MNKGWFFLLICICALVGLTGYLYHSLTLTQLGFMFEGFFIFIFNAVD
jgi:hypothetical protein